MAVRPWSITEDIFLLRNKDELSNSEIGQILDRNRFMVKGRIDLLMKEKQSIEQLECHEKYIIENHKVQTRVEMAEALNVGNATITFRLLALEEEKKLNSKDVPKKLKYEPRAITNDYSYLDYPISKMTKEIEPIIDPDEGIKLHEVNIELGKIYEITVNTLRDNSTRYINYFKGKAIYNGPYFIVFRSKLGYNESFLKSSIAIREVTIKQVTHQKSF